MHATKLKRPPTTKVEKPEERKEKNEKGKAQCRGYPNCATMQPLHVRRNYS